MEYQKKYLKSGVSHSKVYNALENSDGIFVFSALERYIKISRDIEISLYVDTFYMSAIIPAS